MANQKREEVRQDYLRREKKKQFLATSKKLIVFPCIAAAILAVTLLLFFLPWAEVYNSNLSSSEASVSGWNCFLAGITGNYTDLSPSYGDMAVPFYYYSKGASQSFGILTLLSFFFILFSLALQTVSIFKKNHAVNYVTSLLNTVVAIFLIICFSVAFSYTNTRLITSYYSGDVYSIRSFAIIPAIAMIGAAVLNAVAAYKYSRAKKLLL